MFCKINHRALTLKTTALN